MARFGLPVEYVHCVRSDEAAAGADEEHDSNPALNLLARCITREDHRPAAWIQQEPPMKSSPFRSVAERARGSTYDPLNGTAGPRKRARFGFLGSAS